MTTVKSITAFKGQSISFECTPTPNNTMVQWSYNQLTSERVTFSPPSLHHTASISDLRISDSGEYTCYVEGSRLYINKTISVTVLEGMYLCKKCLVNLCYMTVCMHMSM